jgi:DNA invertase Pin-like site-specific DNA recombinase
MGDGRKRAIARGVKFGRKDGEIESKDKFMNKPSTKEVIELLKKGKTYRDIENITGISPKKIGKVRKLLIDDGVIETNKKNGRIVPNQRKFF